MLSSKKEKCSEEDISLVRKTGEILLETLEKLDESYSNIIERRKLEKFCTENQDIIKNGMIDTQPIYSKQKDLEEEAEKIEKKQKNIIDQKDILLNTLRAKSIF